MPTIADRLSKPFENNGQRHMNTPAGVNLMNLCSALTGDFYCIDFDKGTQIYNFRDGSKIIFTASTWEIG